MRFLALIAAVLWLARPAPATEAGWPEKLPLNRYDAMREQSPFALATVVEPPKAPTESFAANWELTGLAKLRDGQGLERDFVTIRSRDKRVSFSLFGDEPSTDPDARGITIAAVDRSPATRKSKVTLKRGVETAVVEFGQEVAPPPLPPNPGGPNGGVPRGFQLPTPGAFGSNFPAPGAGNVRPGLPMPAQPSQSNPVRANGATLPNGISPFPPTSVINNNAPNNAAPNAALPPRTRYINTRP